MIIVHDPQPAAITQHVPEKAQHWVWRCHIDLSTPNPDAIERIVPLVRELRRVASSTCSSTSRPGWTAAAAA